MPIANKTQRVLLALPTYGIIGQFTDPPSPCHVFECLAIASHPNTRHAEDLLPIMKS